MQIIADSASLYSPQEGNEMGVTIVPACVIVEETAYRDFTDISTEKLLEMVAAGAVPKTSQPAIGDVLEVLEATDEEILYLSLGDGLSGAYQNAMGARNCVENEERIHIIDTKTLAGAQRYLVQKALKLREEGLQIDRIKEALERCIETSMSFVIPADFEFLKRSGRLTPIAAKIGGVIKLVPVLTQTEDKKRITPLTIKRSQKKAVEAIITYLKEKGVNENYLINICHAGALEAGKEVLNQIRQQFTAVKTELLQLSPTLVTHGGPGSIVIQAIMM